MPLLLPTSETIAQLGKILRAGALAALPTETVYGLAADATNPEAVLKIYQAKGRPRFNPLIMHVPDLITAQQYGQFDEKALKLAAAFWPGPLTLVVPYVGETIPDLVRAGLPSVAIRVPAHPLMQEVLRATGRPLAAPSANKSGHVSATQASHVANDFGPDLPILEGGPSTLGLESTIVDCTTPTPTLLRAGGLPRAEVEGVLGQTLRTFEPSNIEHAVKAPGMLLKHYAPKAKVRLNVTHLEAGEALLAFGDISFLRASNIEPSIMRNLSPTQNLPEAALNLFAMLRELDAHTPTAIAVMPIPQEGLGEAIHDRLQRAAAGR
jgi:L-threonylcarbamoyladenylate synthase